MSTGLRLALLCQAALLAWAAGCGGKGGGEAAGSGAAVLRGLTVERVTAAPVAETLEVSGTVRARTTALLSARIPGAVSGVYAREGERVRQGRLLVTLESREATAGAAGAAHAVSESEAAVEEAAARKRLADVTFERFARLYREEAVTRQELDVRLAERETADRALAGAAARLAQAREGRKTATATAAYTRITAPLNGLVTARSVDPGATVFPGSPLMTLEGEGGYRLELNAPESLLGRVGVGDRVRASLDGVAVEMDSKVVEVVPMVDPVSRTFTVKVEVTAAGARGGQFGRARLRVGERRALLIPRPAVVERGQLTSVWVVDGRETARMRLVRAGGLHGERVEILAGLTEGERIVVRGAERVTDGARINN